MDGWMYPRPLLRLEHLAVLKTKLSTPYSQHVFQFSLNTLLSSEAKPSFFSLPSCTMMTAVFLEYMVRRSEAHSISNDESQQERIKTTLHWAQIVSMNWAAGADSQK